MIPLKKPFHQKGLQRTLLKCRILLQNAVENLLRLPDLGNVFLCDPWLGVQSQSRTRLRIVTSIAFFFLTGFRHYSTTIARLNFLGGLEQGV